jgi:hypothetical protein
VIADWAVLGLWPRGFYQPDGSAGPIEWSASEDVGLRRVGSTRVGPWRVSTVLLPMQPVVKPGEDRPFETMVFNAAGRPVLDQWRWVSRQQAEVGHQLVVILAGRCRARLRRVHSRYRARWRRR